MANCINALKKYYFIILLFCGACRQPSTPALRFSVDKKQGTVQFIGLSKSVVADIKRDTSLAGGIYTLLPVYKMPADTDLKNYQRAITGLYDFNNDTISFKPDTPLVKNQVYFTRYYRHDEGINLLDMVKGHKKPGALTYTELIFKY